MAFIIPIKDSPITLVAKIREAVTDNNGKFTGDENQGDIEISSHLGKIQVAYKIDDQEINVEVLKKPFLISEEIIKNEILKYL
jgi:tryptophanyl-tRNA synthetase